jgi:acylphosphatase
LRAEGTTRRFVVRGRVQGVGFRWFVLREATQLDLEGFVRNLPDGSVEVLVRGPLPAVLLLESHLMKGPSSATVRSVEKEDAPHDTKLPNPFGVR